LFAISSVPVYVNGRGDLGRTPVLSQLDLYLYHEFNILQSERFRFRIDANISNVLNQDTVTGRYTNYLNRNDGSYLQFANPVDYFRGFNWKAMVVQQGLRTDPGYNQDSAWQSPRDMRFGLKFIF
jgi:3',5'-cyclic AMP phosphodiesterase CpdA